MSATCRKRKQSETDRDLKRLRPVDSWSRTEELRIGLQSDPQNTMAADSISNFYGSSLVEALCECRASGNAALAIMGTVLIRPVALIARMPLSAGEGALLASVPSDSKEALLVKRPHCWSLLDSSGNISAAWITDSILRTAFTGTVALYWTGVFLSADLVKTLVLPYLNYEVGTMDGKEVVVYNPTKETNGAIRVRGENYAPKTNAVFLE
jgi:hypothetical protein